MKKLVLLSAATFCSVVKVYAQVWKPVKNVYQAKYVIYATTNKAEADVIGYNVDAEYKAIKPGLIYLAPTWYSKGKPVYFTKDPNAADIKVYWTQDENEVIWKH